MAYLLFQITSITINFAILLFSAYVADEKIFDYYAHKDQYQNGSAKEEFLFAVRHIEKYIESEEVNFLHKLHFS